MANGSPRSLSATLAALLATGTVLACSRAPDGESNAKRSPRAVESPASPGGIELSRKRGWTFDGSAYSATLAHDGEGFYVITDRAVHRVPFHGAVEKQDGHFGTWPALADEVVVWFARDALWQVSKRGGEPMPYVELSAEPERIVASGTSVVWQLRRRERGFALGVRRGRTSSIIYESDGKSYALAVDETRAYFVEARGDAFRIGAVSLGGGEPIFSAEERGRPPAMLAVRSGEVFFYDGARSVRRLAADLAADTVLARETICSPLAVGEAVYCAAPRQVVEVREGKAPRILASDVPGPITSIDVAEGHVAWIVDLGDGRLGLESREIDTTR